MSNFFQLLEQEGVQLESFRMPRLKVLTRFNSFNRLILSVPFINFLKMQTGLADVNLNDGNTYEESGVLILENLVAEPVEHLRVQNLFYDPLEITTPDLSNRFLSAITRFHGLRSLWINHQYLTNRIMELFATSLEGHLEVLNIQVGYMEIRQINLNHVTTPLTDNSWIALKAKCPRVQVFFRFEINLSSDITPFINGRYMSPEIPLVSIQYMRSGRLWLWMPDGEMFDFLVNTFADTLRNAEFSVAGALCLITKMSNMVDHCPVLENLTIRVLSPIFRMPDFLDAILSTLQHIDGGMRSLKVLRVTFRNLNPPIKRSARTPLLRVYVPRFKELGIQLKLKIKK